MSPAERRLWIRAQRRAASLSPDISREILRSFARLKESLSDVELARAIERGTLDEIIDQATLKSAFEPLQEAVQEATGQAMRQFSKDLPGNVSTAFNVLNPTIIDAVRNLDASILGPLQSDVREMAQAVIENGLRDGLGTKEIARNIRNLVGLSKDQVQQVRNYRDALEGKNNRDVADYTLRDKRFKGELSPEKIDKMVSAYERRRIALNAEAVAQRATVESMKVGQRLSVESAVDRGIYDESRLMRKWIGVGDDRERPEHLAMNDEVVPWDQPYSSGQSFAGEGDWGCRCVDSFGYFTQ